MSVGHGVEGAWADYAPQSGSLSRRGIAAGWSTCGETVPERRLAVFAGSVKSVTSRPGRRPGPGRPLERNERAGREPALLEKRDEDPAELVVADGVRRIGEDEVPQRTVRAAAEHPLDPVGDQPCAWQAHDGNVLPDHLGRPSIGLYEQDVSGAARQRLQPDRARSRVQVEHRGTVEAAPDGRYGREQSLPGPIARRPRSAAGRGRQP